MEKPSFSKRLRLVGIYSLGAVLFLGIGGAATFILKARMARSSSKTGRTATRPTLAAQEKLQDAVKKGDAVEIRRAISLGANPNGFGELDMPLQIAVGNHDLETVKLLVEAGADPNKNDPTFRSALAEAADQGDSDMALYLIQQGADPCLKYYGGTAADFARKKGHVKLSYLLRAAGPCFD